jgi:hypothetical protein
MTVLKTPPATARASAKPSELESETPPLHKLDEQQVYVPPIPSEPAVQMVE